MFTYRLIKAFKKENTNDFGMFAFVETIVDTFRFVGAVTLDLCIIAAVILLIMLITYIF